MGKYKNYKGPVSYVWRVLFFAIGQLFLTAGICLGKVSKFGVSAGASVPNIANIISDGKITLGQGMTYFFYFFIACHYLTILIKKQKWSWLYLFEFAGALITGWFTDLNMLWIAPIASGLHPENSIVLQIVFTVLSALFQGFGLAIYIDTDLFPNPPEAMMVAIQMWNPKWKLSSLKIATDCTYVCLSLIAGFIAKGMLFSQDGIWFGTVFLALAVGRVMGWLRPIVSPPLKKLFYGEPPVEETDAQPIPQEEEQVQ